jgi:hypothetical protein
MKTGNGSQILTWVSLEFFFVDSHPQSQVKPLAFICHTTHKLFVLTITDLKFSLSASFDLPKQRVLKA